MTLCVSRQHNKYGDARANFKDAVHDTADEYEASSPQDAPKPKMLVYSLANQKANLAVEAVHDAVVKARSLCKQAPFESFDLAWEWIEQHSSHPTDTSRKFLRFGLQLEGVGSSARKAFDKLNMSAEIRSGQYNAAETLRRLADVLEGDDVRLTGPTCVESGTKDAEGIEDAEVIRMGDKRITALWGDAWRMWKDHAKAVAALTGWWTQAQALEHILTGFVPHPGIYAEYEAPDTWNDPPVPPKITIKMGAPATPSDLREFYQGLLTEIGAGAKKLTETHKALLELKASTPGQTWTGKSKKGAPETKPTRQAIWAEWCKENPNLTPFGGRGGKHPKADANPENIGRVMAQEVKTAKERAQWFRPEKIATTVPQLTPNKAKSKPVKS
jgi:hypothetical protein